MVQSECDSSLAPSLIIRVRKREVHLTQSRLYASLRDFAHGTWELSRVTSTSVRKGVPMPVLNRAFYWLALALACLLFDEVGLCLQRPHHNKSACVVV